MKEVILSEEKLRSLGVGVVYLFGSRAEGVAGPASDIDVGVLFTNPKIARGNTTEVYGALYDIFCDAFDTSNFRTIDIVFFERAPLELQFDAIAHGKALFEISSDFRLDFEERVSALYRDFKPLLLEQNAAIMQRI